MVFLEPLLQCFAGRQGVQLGKEGWLQKSLQLNEGHISFRAGLVFIIFFFLIYWSNVSKVHLFQQWRNSNGKGHFMPAGCR